MSRKASVYFPNINSIRFIAALLVIIGHINMVQDIFGWPSFVNNPFIMVSGRLGVILFFVLSGFLITYLLFKEEEVTGTISIRDFYIRRVLRIWPLYYLIVILALFVLPYFPFFEMPNMGKEFVLSHFGAKLPLYLLILPNLVLSIFGEIPYVVQAWSIGAEEQFYLIWPVLMKKIKKNRLALMLGVIFIFGIVKALLNHYAGHDDVKGTPSALTIVNRFWATMSTDCMAIGGLFALIGYSAEQRYVRIRNILFARPVQIAAWLLAIAMIGTGVKIPHIQYEVFGLIFGIIIFNLALNPKNLVSLEFGWLSYLGKISYGLYMYHTIVIVFCFHTLRHFGLLQNIYLYPSVIGLSIVVAGLSYRFFEKPFIARKVKFSRVVSGDNTNEAKHIEP